MKTLDFKPMRHFALVFALALSGCTLAIGSLEECSTDEQCAAKHEGLVCREQMCVWDPQADCHQDSDCTALKGEGYTCRVAQGVCVKKAECSQDGDCTSKGADFQCKAGSCVQKADPFAPFCTRVLGTDSPSSVWFGAVLPMTTPAGDKGSGEGRTQAMQLALDDLNQNGGVAGHGVAIRVCDTQGGTSDRAKDLANYLVQKGIPAILTGGSGDTLAVAAVTVPAGALLMSISATTPAIADLDDHDLVWRTAPSDALQGQVIANTLRGEGIHNVAVFELDDPYGYGLSKVFRGAFKDTAGGFNAERFIYKRGGSDIDGALSSAASSGSAFDVALVIGFYDDAAKIVNGLAGQPKLSSLPLFFTDAAKNDALLTGVTDESRLEGSRGTVPGTPSGEVFDNFSTRYMQQYKSAGYTSLPSYTAHSYDAVYSLALAATWAGGADGKGAITGAAMAEGMKHLTVGDPADNTTYESSSLNKLFGAMRQHVGANVTGASGSLDFDASGDPPGNVQLWRVRGGKIVIE